MIPHVGQTVLTEGITSNGLTVHPAIITRVWSPGQSLGAGPVAVNLTVLPDGASWTSRSSVMMFAGRREALVGGQGLVAYPLEA
jgi:hypothetical protein